MKAHSATQALAEDPPYYVKALAIGIPAFLIGIHLATWISMLPISLGGRADFRIFYTTGHMLRSGYRSQLYDYATQLHFQNTLVSKGDIALRFNHLAYEGLIFAPFSLLVYRKAYFAFLAVNVALLALCYRLLRPHIQNLREVFPWLPAALFLGFLPIAAALVQGQDSIVLLALITAGVVMLERGHDLAAGVFVGAGLFKFQIVGPILLFFLVWRRWRFVSGFMTTAAIVGAISLALTGFEPMKVYAHSLVSMSVAKSAADRFRYGISPNQMANLRGLVYGLISEHLSSRWMQATTAVASGLVFVLTAGFGRKKHGRRMPILIAITAASLVSYHMLIHDLSVLLIPVILLLNDFLPAEAAGDAHSRMLFRLAALTFFSPICHSYIPQQFYLVCLPVLGLLWALLWNRHRRSSPLART